MGKNEIFENLPNFRNIDPKKIVSELEQILASNLQRIDELLAKNSDYNWDNLMQPIEELEDQLNNMWSPVSHLHAVMNSKELREAYQACLPKLSEYSTTIGQNEKLFNAIKALQKKPSFKKLDIAQKKIIENNLRDFMLAGVALEESKKKRYIQLSKKLSELCNQFEENLLDATQGWFKLITDEKELKGLPKHAIDAAKQNAEKHNQIGWRFSLEIPDYLAIITFSELQHLREEMYRAYVTRASDQGPNADKWDNSQIMLDILKTRSELAKLLGFNNYAQMSLIKKMIKSPERVLEFLHKLAHIGKPKAEIEFSELLQFAKENLKLNTLNSWDIAHASEKLRQHRYAISQEELRPYFPEPKVLAGLFAIVNKLFSVEIKSCNDLDTWHPDVKTFAIYDKEGLLRAKFYFDLYARENKRGGAWMDECRVRRRLKNNTIQLPIAYVTCNFSCPIGSDPALFTHDEVVTLFHEFGHALQHMLTQVERAEVSGINGVPWDAVEIASQFLENWAWQKESIMMIAKHYKTGKTLPEELYEKMHRAKNFQSAMQMMRQLEFALFDFRLHMEFDPSQTNQIQKILNEVRDEVAVSKPPSFNRFQHGFSHIFAGGYAAGYYSYKWAEVMSSDAFSLFAENGIFDRKTSQKFLKTILESGGVREPMDLFIEFRGREPQVEALLKQDGIIEG